MVDAPGGKDGQADDERSRRRLDTRPPAVANATGRQPVDEFGHELNCSLDNAALREQAIGVLAEYHQIELSEADDLLHVLAEYRNCSVDALAVEVLRRVSARRPPIDELPTPGALRPDDGGSPH